MTEFLSSLKGDLLDRRLAPFVAVILLALLGAVAYAVLGGSSSSPPSSSASVTPSASSTHASGITVSAVQSPAESGVGETTSGAPRASEADLHDPFTPLPEAKVKSSATASASSKSTSSGSSASSSAPAATGGAPASGESGASSGSSTESGGSSPSKPKSQSKPKNSYEVNVLFGTAAAGTPALSAQLQTVTALKRQQPLPSATNALVVFRGVMSGGKGATFTIVGEAILRGQATCLPSASQCQAIELKEGQTEELEVTQANGSSLVYELYVLAIKQTSGSTQAGAASAGESKLGLALLRHAGLVTIPGSLRYSPKEGVLVYVAPDASDRVRSK